MIGWCPDMIETVIVPGQRNGVIAVAFESPAEFADAADACRSTERYRDDLWAGGSWSEAVTECRNGAERYVAKVSKILDSINVEVPRCTWINSPCGAFPVVPEVLAGRPDPMRRRVPVDCATSPVRMYLDLVSSAGIPVDDLRKRGTAFLALAMALTQIRPVEMYAAMPNTTSEGAHFSTLITIRLDTAPLDTASVAAMFCNTAITRHLAYSYCAIRAGQPQSGLYWYRGISPNDDEQRLAYVAAVKADLGAGPDDVYMAPVFLTDDAIKDPEGFVRRSIAEHSTARDSSAA